MTSLAQLDVGSPPAAFAEALLERGAVIVRDLLSESTLARLNAEVDPLLAAADPTMQHLNPAIGFFFGNRTRHVSGMAGKSRTFATDVLCHPTMLAVCDQVLLPACARYQLNIGHTIDRGPGSDAQILHRDEDVWIHVPRPAPVLQVASMIALVDFTRENGATRVVPGSHRWPRERNPLDAEIVDAEMPAGSAVLYLGWTIHGAGSNTTGDQWRRGLHLSYLVGWLRTEENNVLATPPSVARGLPRKAQELVGYAVHDAIEHAGGYCGMVDLRDPVDLLNEGKL